MTGDVLRRITEARPEDLPGGKMADSREETAGDTGSLRGRDCPEPRTLEEALATGWTVAVPGAPAANRLTVVETVVYQDGSERPVCTDARFSRVSTTDEQPYVRRLTLAGEWVPLDTGWLGDKVATVVVENPRPARQATPSPQERAAEDGAAVEVGPLVPNGIGDADGWPVLLVPVGEACRFNFVDPAGVRLRCRAGRAKVTVTAFPA